MRSKMCALLGALALALAATTTASASWFYRIATFALPDGRTLHAGGYARESDLGPFHYVWAVVRFTADGAYDTTFNGIGVVTIPFYHYYEFASLVALQPDGKLVVAGSASDPVTQYGCYCGHVAVARLNPDGTLDRSFNGTGRVILDFGDEWFPTSLRIETNGAISLLDGRGAAAGRLHADGTVDTSFLGSVGRPRAIAYGRVLVAETYNAALDHYFITWVPDEIEALEAGSSIHGWRRTGKTFQVDAAPRPGLSPVCRFYIPPALGDSHFFGRDPVECADTAARHPAFVLESAAFLYVALPIDGACASGTTPLYRLFNNRADANHRYTIDRTIRDQMVGKGWIAEGDGPDQVAMCVPG